MKLIFSVLAIVMCSIVLTHGTPMKSIQLNKHLHAVSGKSIESMVKFREINMADGEESESEANCYDAGYEKIDKINEDNNKEMKDCIAKEEESLKENNDKTIELRKELDEETQKIIEKLQKCLALEDNLESIECSSKADSNNIALIDNSGTAVGIFENMKAENENVRAESRYCVDKSLRTAQKKIADEQKEIKACLKARQ